MNREAFLDHARRESQSHSIQMTLAARDEATLLVLVDALPIHWLKIRFRILPHRARSPAEGRHPCRRQRRNSRLPVTITTLWAIRDHYSKPGR